MNALNSKFVKDTLFKLRYGFKGVPIKVDNQLIRLDESLRSWNFEGESGMQAVLKNNLSSGDCFIDVGANFGMHTLYAAKLVGEMGRVFAFEPVPSNLNLLKKNIHLNHLEQQVKVIPKALSNSPDPFLTFHVPVDEVAVTASLRPDKTTQEAIQVANTRLDDYWNEVNLPVKIIKIDVEGAELEVLRGAEQLIRRQKPLLLIEVHGFAFPDFGTNLDEFRKYLEALGYTESQLSETYFQGDKYFQALYSVKFGD
ncbi:MAG: FkbM family methyltransferase [Moorea sp. SIO1F2]|uniref:FkbM family methyltransferase n=1 Tax=Moorena sp. SIO1F2 TaxID=2607819 RepID=UPI0013BE4960|nr:FkbM family methyltransferase [Moorena sp. SIO1F2]NET85501.1 FkbM family methyltransferase [Moorena sp. SIO1F2]